MHEITEYEFSLLLKEYNESYSFSMFSFVNYCIDHYQLVKEYVKSKESCTLKEYFKKHLTFVK